MIKDIQRLRVLYQELRNILEIESDDNEAMYITNQLESGLSLIDECLNNTYTDKDLKQLYSKLNEIYIKINQPRVGLSDFFIWRDNNEERLKANDCLDSIKDNLLFLFQKY